MAGDMYEVEHLPECCYLRGEEHCDCGAVSEYFQRLQREGLIDGNEWTPKGIREACK